MHVVQFKQVDVFAECEFGGNPVAVILDGEDLSDAEMQKIARWTNLSETTFVLPPSKAGASYRVRIFTPGGELPFAGHPSLGTAHAVIEGDLARPVNGLLIQQCDAGLLPVRVTEGQRSRRCAVRVPPAKLGDPDDKLTDALAKALGAAPRDDLPPRAIDVGPVWLIAGYADAATVRSLRPDYALLTEICRQTGATGVTVFGAEPVPGTATPDNPCADAVFAVRSFTPIDGIAEDPVCGSGNAANAAFLQAGDALPARDYAVSQGREVGREGRVAIHIADDGGIEIEGRTLTRIDGVIRLD